MYIIKSNSRKILVFLLKRAWNYNDIIIVYFCHKIFQVIIDMSKALMGAVTRSFCNGLTMNTGRIF